MRIGGLCWLFALRRDIGMGRTRCAVSAQGEHIGASLRDMAPPQDPPGISPGPPRDLMPHATTPSFLSYNSFNPSRQPTEPAPPLRRPIIHHS